jgi:transcriptional regulator with XRE-family HTH domain
VSETFGEFVRSLRVSKRLSLRAVCRATGYDPSNWSKVERGILAPPSDEATLKQWAAALEIEEGSKDFRTFTDLAVIAAGVIPQDILEREDVMQHVPAFFRTIRGQKPTKEEIDRLIDLLRNS